MLRILFAFVLMIGTVGCKTTQDRSELQEEAYVRFDVLIQFKSEEDVKRVPFQLPKLRLELLQQVEGSDNLYNASIHCRPSNLNSILEKMQVQDGIVWVKKR